jgi:uncharacterized protein (DUF983 family)
MIYDTNCTQIGALITHCYLFWGGTAWRAFKSSRNAGSGDRHHVHMVSHYKEVPWWWFAIILAGSFVLGAIVVSTQNITMPVWAYVLSLLLGTLIAPLSTLLYSRFGNGIATNNLSKMLAGLMLPERPIGNSKSSSYFTHRLLYSLLTYNYPVYFAAWSHSMILNCVNLSNDLKMGEYRKSISSVTKDIRR